MHCTVGDHLRRWAVFGYPVIYNLAQYLCLFMAGGFGIPPYHLRFTKYDLELLPTSCHLIANYDAISNSAFHPKNLILIK